MNRYQLAAIEINGVWLESVSHLPLGAVELISVPSDDEITEIIQRHFDTETAPESTTGGEQK